MSFHFNFSHNVFYYIPYRLFHTDIFGECLNNTIFKSFFNSYQQNFIIFVIDFILTIYIFSTADIKHFSVNFLVRLQSKDLKDLIVLIESLFLGKASCTGRVKYSRNNL